MTQRLFGGVVGLRDALVVEKRPQILAMLDQLFAKAMGERVAVAAQQKRIDLLAERLSFVRSFRRAVL